MITMKRSLILLALCLAVASTAGAARVSRARRLQEEISWPRCVCDKFRGPNPYYVTYIKTVAITVDLKNETNSRFVHQLEINTLPYSEKPPGNLCWDVLLQELHKVIFDVSSDCKAAFNSAGNTVRVNGSKWSNFQYVIDRPDTDPPLAELKIAGLQNFTYAAIQKSFIIEIGTVNNTCTKPSYFFKNLDTRVSFMDRAQNCCGDPKQPGNPFPPPPPPLGFPHPGCGVDRMNEIPFKLEWAPPKNGNPCFKIVQKTSCDSACCGMRVEKIEFLQKPVCSVNNPGKAPLRFKSYEDTGAELNAGSNFTAFAGLSATGAVTSTNPVYGVVKANNLKWSNQEALDRTICLLMDQTSGTGPVDCSLINNNFYIPFGPYYGIPYSIFDSTSQAGCCGNGFLFPTAAGNWPTGEPGPVIPSA